MLDPFGPLPEEVYWRRRGVAFGALVATLVLVVWGISALTGGGDPDPPDRAAATGAIGAPSSAVLAPTPTPSGLPSVRPSPAAAAVSPTSAGSPASAQATATSAVPSLSAAPSSPSAAPSGSCPDRVIGLTAQPSSTEYRPGQPREFRMIVANVGSAPCTRDLDAALQEVLVLGADGTRLWSSNDCDGGGSTSVRTLTPGKPLVFSVVWAGRTSRPGCPSQREAVPAGTYQLVVKLGPLASAPTTFRLLG